MRCSRFVSAAAALCLSIGASFAATPTQPFERDASSQLQDQVWTANGGELKLRFNTDLLELKGIRVEGAEPAAGQPPEDIEFAVFRLQARDGLQLNAPEGGFDRFVGGMVQAEGGFALQLADGSRIGFGQIQLRPSRSNGAELELVGDDGRAWLYVNHLMYKMVDDYQGFYIRSADLRATAALAERVGMASLADAYVGELKMLANVAARPAGFVAPDPAAVLACPDFHGTGPAPNGQPFQADVLMESYSMSFSRCRNSAGANGCDGAGADDGQVVFTPSSTLRNTNFPNSADVPWYRKFTLSPFNYPYPGNDQHPYLIWNMYRIVDGQLEQIGASGVKHAFLTINSGCAPGACTGSGHILGKNCGDTYGTGNNDSNSDLGPRRELVAATGYWGRCRSIYDSNCDGVANASGNTSYDQRLVVRESQMQVAGAQFFSESWYIVQDDINIYNTMAHRTMAPAPGGSSWIPGSQGSFVLGPIINAWVNPASNPTRNIEIATDEGHSRIAVKVKTLDSCPVGSGLTGTCYRYDYAVNNFDFARAVYGAPPNDQPPNLEVLSNKGFQSFTLPTGGKTVYVEPGANFADIDTDAGNNWIASQGPAGVTWTAPAGNELNWGLLFRFSVVSSSAPQDARVAPVTLGVAGPGEPAELSGAIIVPRSELDDLFSDGFELP